MAPGRPARDNGAAFEEEIPLKTDRRRSIPSVDKVLAEPRLAEALRHWRRQVVLSEVREVLDKARSELRAGKSEGLEAAEAASRAARGLDRLDADAPRRVVNATGVVIHTNLGRARLSQEVAEALVRVATGYSDLEFDVARGERGSRQVHVAPWLQRLFPGKGVLAVNNNAAAVMLALNTLALGKGVAISRGELVEIGGSFRVPAILERSGARLVEVGTTNRTHRRDYEAVVGEEAAMVLKVWPSNYRVIGFTKSVPTKELVEVAHEKGVPVLTDQGCGRLFKDAPGPESEVSVEELLEQGVDLVCFSGDKILGGPQCGILVGDPEIVAACAKNPMARALRLGKLSLAALSATCRHWLRRDPAEELPTADMLSRPLERLEADARQLEHMIREAHPAIETSIVEGSSRVGGGAAPEEDLPTRLVQIKVHGWKDDKILRELRRHDPPVVARLQDGVVFDTRTLAEHEYAIVVDALGRLIS